ncbi:MAG: hypothetical protein CEE41_02355 [Hadesarchaea archaeon B3_Hades]|nr:MAG: hypothetical protein CEE41_02355 [Hadesarchaea archaeon B3_Hades]
MVNKSNKICGRKSITADLENLLYVYIILEVRKRGEKIKKLFIGLSLCAITALLISTTCVKAQELPELQSIENMDVDITLELLPDARCHVTVGVEAQFEMEGWGDLPITNGSAGLEISSPNSGQLKFDVSGSVTFSESGLGVIPEEIIIMNAEMINGLIVLAGIEGQSLSEILPGFLTMIPGAGEIEMPPEMEDIVIEDLRCTKLSWSEPTIEAGLTTTLSGSIFEGEELRDELPITIDGSIDISETSISLTMEASSETVEFTLGFNLTAGDTTAVMELTLDGYFKLPVVGDQVQFDFELPEIDIPGLENFALENLGEFLAQYDIYFTLKVPEDASVGGLPPGYSQADDTYTWSGVDAAGALDMVLTGEAQPDITYGYEAPPSEFPWLVVGVLVVVIVAIVVAVVVLRRR